MTTWTNQAGKNMAIATSAVEACALWQADAQSALDAGLMTLEDLGGEMVVYQVDRTERIISDIKSYANDSEAPSYDAVIEAAERGELFEYN